MGIIKTPFTWLTVMVVLSSAGCGSKRSGVDAELSSIDLLRGDIALCGDPEFGEIDFQAIASYLSSERSFSLDRVETSLNRLKKAKERKSHTLEQWMN